MTVPLDEMHDSNHHNGVKFIIRTPKAENITTSLLSPNKQELSVRPEGEGLMVNPVGTEDESLMVNLVKPEDEGSMVNLVGLKDEGFMVNPKECNTEDEVAAGDLYSNMNLKNGEKNHVKRNTGTEESMSATSSFLLLTIVACIIINFKTIFDSYKILTKSDILYHKPKLKVFCESTFSRMFLKDSVIRMLTKRFQTVFRRDEIANILYPQEYSSFLVNKKGDMTTKESMQFEWCRLSSYASFPNSSVSVIRLAEAGFYYGGNGDEVICPFCGLKRCNWKSNDNPKNIHIEESRDLNCSFVASKLRPVLFKETTAQEETRAHGETTGANGFTDHGESNSHVNSNEPGLTNGDNQSVITETVSFPKSATSTTIYESSIEVGQTCQKTEHRNKIPEFKPETPHLPNTVHYNYSTNDVTGLIRISREGNNSNSPKGDKTPAGAHHSGFNGEFNNMGVCLDKPKYPSYAVRTTRLSSFQHWPSYLTQSPEELAMAGFFYTGIEDHCRCFFCGGGLRRWENGDFPWTEHARWFPKCPFVLQCKGQKYVDDVQLGRDPEQREQLSPPGEEEAHGIPNGVMNNPAVQIVSELGYEPDILISAFESLKHSGVDSITASLLLEAVFELEGNRRPSPVTSSNERTNNEESLSGHIQENEHPEIARNTEPCHELSIRSLEEENRNLKDQQTCKICLDEPVSIVFLPCGHMAACVNCAPALRRCPICRAFIKGTVKAIIC